MDMSTKVVKQLLDAGPKCSSFSFLLTDPVLRAFLYHCRMAHGDGGLRCNVFWKVCIRESEIDGDRTNDSIESFIRVWTDSLHRMKKSKFHHFFHIIVFGHHMLGVAMVVICTGQYKLAHYQTFQQFAFEWYINYVSTILTIWDTTIFYRLVFFKHTAYT